MLMFVTFGTTDFAGVSEVAGEAEPGHAERARPAAPARRLRQVRAGPAAGLAARRDGGPDPGLGPHPRGDHGHRRRLPDRPLQLHLRAHARRPDRRRRRRHRHAPAGVRSSAAPRTTSRRSLAGSTMSQIGYMMLGAGLGPAGYVFAIFHLLTHGFFKANMFLGAGSVMHGMNDDVDMRHYGALRKAMPVTFLTFAMGYLAIIGVPRLLRLLVQGQDHRGRAGRQPGSSACCALLGAGITGVLHDPPDADDLLRRPAAGRRTCTRTSRPKVMTIPLIVLAALSVLGGADAPRRLDRGLPRAGDGHRAPRSTRPSRPSSSPLHRPWSWSRSGSPSPGSWSASATCPARPRRTSPSRPARPASTSTATRSTTDSWSTRAGALVRGLLAFDRYGVDGALTGGPVAVGGVAGQLRRVQNGFVRSYALSLLGGVLLVVLALLAVNLA